MADGDLLPPQAVLVEKLNVSLVPLREALRILETEGLLSVRRGNRGGAVVHAPAQATAAYMLGLVLQSKDVLLSDLATGLHELEPTCAALAAQRPDRATSLVPELRRINELMRERLTDEWQFTDLGRQFHDAIVRGCANETVITVVGTLEALWTSHERQSVKKSAASGRYPSAAKRTAVLSTHVALAEAIERGDAERARRIAAHHLSDAQPYVLGTDTGQRIIAPTSGTRARMTKWGPL